MKFLLSALLFSSSVFAVDLRFYGPCTEEFIMQTEVEEEYATAGDLTVATLSGFSIPFEGSAEKLDSVFVIPATTKYRWCLFVNGKLSEVAPHQQPLTPEVKSLTWIYGSGTMCTPAYQEKPAAFCADEPLE